MILFFALITTFVNAHAQKSNKEENHKPRNLQWREYDGKNGAILWGIIAGHTALIGGGAYAAKVYDNPTDPLLQDAKNYRHNIYNGFFLGSCMVTGLAVVFGTNDLIYYLQNKKKEKVSVKLNVTPASAGLCINF